MVGFLAIHGPYQRVEILRIDSVTMCKYKAMDNQLCVHYAQRIYELPVPVVIIREDKYGTSTCLLFSEHR
jgi:hypothetical protein